MEGLARADPGARTPIGVSGNLLFWVVGWVVAIEQNHNKGELITKLIYYILKFIWPLGGVHLFLLYEYTFVQDVSNFHIFQGDSSGW